MASKQSATQGIGTGEMTDIVAAFEKQNTCRIEVCLCTQLWSKNEELKAEATAWSLKSTSGVRLRLASVSVLCSAQRLETFEAVILNLLYALDFALAEREFGRTQKR